MSGNPSTGTQREGNGNWRGGKTVGDNGYIKILVGISHHLSDSKGYAYQHKLVAENKLGRKLLPGEEVHHIDRDRKNNNPDNIEVYPGRREHFFNHRTHPGRRHPGEDNPIVQCQCGCGTAFRKYDKWDRARVIVSGHNLHPGVR